MDSINKRHSNRELAAIIRDSKNMIIADVFEICSVEERSRTESEYIYKLYGEGHRLVNITDPVNPRQKLSYLIKDK